jgi:PPE-repeat protein
VSFLLMPPEVNSARIYAGAGAGTLFTAAAAWDGLASDLHASAASFGSLIAALIGGPWSGPASAAMAAAAAPYASWLAGSAARAQSAATQARTAATAFEAARTATVHPAAVTANRTQLVALVATNFLGQNTPAIAGTESDYVEMWAQDVSAMVGYHAGASSVASALTADATDPPAAPPMAPPMETGMTSTLQQTVQAVLQEVLSAAQLLSTPAGILTSPLTSLAQSATGGAGLSAATGLGADVPKLIGAPVPDVKPLGGDGVPSPAVAPVSAGLGNARLVGAMSVPPGWAGSTPARMGSAAVSGLGAAQMPSGAMTQAAGGVPMMPMPMGGAGAGGGMMARGGASPHVLQNRPSVIPRTGVG